MNILLVEDDEEKRRQVATALAEIAPGSLVEEARSLRSGLRAILSGQYDLLILDMSMPTFDTGEYEGGGRPQAYAGRELLWHMKRRRIVTPCVVLTQFDRFGEGSDVSTLEELDHELRSELGNQYLGAIRYNVTYRTWRSELEEVMSAQERIHEEGVVDA